MNYLKITLPDSDFYNEMDWLGKYLLFRLSNNTSHPFEIENINFDRFKDAITNFLLSVTILHEEKWFKLYDDHGITDIWDYYKEIKKFISSVLRIEIVNEREICENNYETLYVPFCTSNDIHVKGISYFVI